MKDGLQSLLRKITRRMYGTQIKVLLEKTGTYHFFKNLYWHVLWNLSKDISVNNISIKTPTPEVLNWYFFGIESEREVIDDFIEELSQEDVFWDVGGFLGLYSSIAGQIVEKGNVFSFEPIPHNYRMLKKSLTLNAQGATTFNYALSNKEGEILLDSESITNGTVLLSEAGEKEIAVFSGDALVRNEDANEPDVLKIDVEGAELKVLEGMQDILEGVRVVYCEVHTNVIHNYGDSARSLEKLLQDHSFSTSRIYERDHQYFLKAVKS